MLIKFWLVHAKIFSIKQLSKRQVISRFLVELDKKKDVNASASTVANEIIKTRTNSENRSLKSNKHIKKDIKELYRKWKYILKSICRKMYLSARRFCCK